MHHQVVSQQAIHLYGLQVELTTSHALNQKIITAQWQRFNHALKSNHIKLGTNWKKYGVTLKSENRYVYMTAIESNTRLSGFDYYQLQAGQYLYFQHLGAMELIKVTINRIYKKVIPEQNLTLNPNRSLIHFECYDQQFQWNHPDSVIHIFVPI
ncbi:GyrI-like domain-containing protein [Marinicellulosiphila megalodicopiae]|uniref:GyrI-like domain-containing protein n=1 Tax=Marinicellulosiphila megalodicopiae TaxID=2724896 RepID=UPI003BAEBAA2